MELELRSLELELRFKLYWRNGKKRFGMVLEYNGHRTECNPSLNPQA